MQELAEVIENCHACGNAMDVSAMGPFSNVACPTCGAHNRVKCVFGPYQLERRHSLGGMSTVFVARDLTLDREVAVKILNEQWCEDEKRIAAFVDEARLTASFTHPNVVRVFRTGWAFGRFYIAMELVPGAHLEHWIKEKGRIPEIEVLNMAIQVVQGLRAAQAAGLIHRDMKPGNILLDDQGNAKIVDFGLALVTQGGAAQAKELWATPYYVPPEAIEGKPETFRSDMYAFGATLYHALAGVPPCVEETMDTEKLREAKKHIRLLQRECEDLSNATCRIVNRAMAYAPEDRYDSYDEMFSLLEEARNFILSGNIHAGTPKKSPAAMIVLGIAGLIIVALSAWWIFRGKSPEAAPDPVSQTKPGEKPAQIQETNADVFLIYQESSRHLFAKDYAKARTGLVSIRDFPKVQEPTGSWAGIECVVITALTGDLSSAQKDAAVVLKHIRDRAVNDFEIQHRLVPRLEDFNGLPLIDAGDIEKITTRADVLAAMLGGLKNWEQGDISTALPFFQSIASLKNESQDPWFGFYQRIADDYLSDGKWMQDEVFEKVPESASETRAAIERLESFLPELKTQGRARFNIRAWQLDLAKLEKTQQRLAKESQVHEETKPETSVQKTPDEIVEKVSAFANAGDYSAARAYLQEIENRAAAENLERILTNHQSMMENFQENLGKTPVKLPLTLRSGESISSLSLNSHGKPITDKNQVIQWSDLSADSIIALHRYYVQQISDRREIMRRHELAISADWLTGNRQRALETATRLGESDADFKKRWDGFLESLK